MQYDLLQYRGLQINDNIPSMAFLYSYSQYKKEREERAAKTKKNRVRG